MNDELSINHYSSTRPYHGKGIKDSEWKRIYDTPERDYVNKSNILKNYKKSKQNKRVTQNTASMLNYISPFILKSVHKARERVKNISHDAQASHKSKKKWDFNTFEPPKLFDPSLKKQEIFKPERKIRYEKSINDELDNQSKPSSKSPPKRDYIQDNMTIRTTGVSL